MGRFAKMAIAFAFRRSCRHARAQFGYPAGYGGYGWGGWGSTIQGSNAAGPGLFQHGARRLQREHGRGPVDQ